MTQNNEIYLLEECRAGLWPGFSVRQTIIRKKLVDEAVVFAEQMAGEYKRYYQNGKLCMHAFYREGCLEGQSTTYFENGREASKTYFCKNKAEGQVLRYFQTGAVAGRLQYIGGRMSGLQQFYYENGTVRCEFFCTDGVLESKARLYFPNATIRREIVLKSGKRHGIDYMYDDDGLILFALEYEEGRFSKTHIQDPIAKAYHL